MRGWSRIMHKTMDDAIVKQTTSEQRLGIRLQHVAIEHKSNNLIVGQFSREVTPKPNKKKRLISDLASIYTSTHFLKSPMCSSGAAFTSFRSSLRYFNFIRNSVPRSGGAVKLGATTPLSPPPIFRPFDGVGSSKAAATADSSMTLPFSLFSLVQFSVFAARSVLSDRLIDGDCTPLSTIGSAVIRDDGPACA